MLNTKEQILQFLDTLIAEGNTLISPQGGVDGAAWDAWRVSAQTLISQLAGTGSQYYTRFSERGTWVFNNKDRLFAPKAALLILQRVRVDYETGILRDLRDAAAAEVFTDFLEMANYLSCNNCAVAAASVAGAVLEDSLRRIHLKHIGIWEGVSGIRKLNDDIKKAELYTQAVWRQVQAWSDIRNDADHGLFNKINTDDVKKMISGVRDFIARYEG